jgi:beta-lactamase class A
VKKRIYVAVVYVAIAGLVVMQHHKVAASTLAVKAKTLTAVAQATPAQLTIKSSSPMRALSLVADLNAAGNNTGLSWAATVIDLNTGKEYDAGATTTIFKAASTAKVLTAVDYLHEVEQGNASLNQSISGVTATQLMKQMIEVSDNTAWADLNNFLGAQEQTYATGIGMSNFTGGDYFTMTASDEAKLLAQLAEGKLINTSDRAILYNFMANTDSSNLIPAALPSGTTIYHKYGELWGNLHDAAIVQYQGHDFVLVIYTNNGDGTMDDYNGQVQLIHDLAATAYKDIENS